METSFAQALDALYVLLDQPAPLRQAIAEGRHEITVETRKGSLGVKLSVSPNERSILVETLDGPRFATDAALRERQIASVLETALGLAATNSASAGMEAVPGEPAALRLRLETRVALTAARNQVGAELKSAIEDIIEQADWQGAHLDVAGLSPTMPGALGRPMATPGTAEEYIFRP